MPSYAKKPVIVPVDLDQQPYPLMFRLPAWHYVLAGAGAVISSLFIAAGFYFTWEARAAVWIFAGFGLLMLAGSLWYLFTIKGTFIELTKDHMRYRDYRKVKEIDLSRIYVEIMNNTFVLYTPEQSQKVIPSIYDNNSLLHSLLFKHSEKNTARSDWERTGEDGEYRSFTDKISRRNSKSYKLNTVFLILCFIAANVLNYIGKPEKSLNYHLLFFLLMTVLFGYALYSSRRRAARSGNSNGNGRNTGR
ncbi:hypothetical protein [Paenibacillus sp. FSL R10-2736]|uniref:hypothetical protein n=1 Tax=Paenibacillus sp. FSL R10-2736 TaxID=2954692 RepID=UPI0030FB48B1